MEGRDEANEFFVDVCEAVQQIPYGKVTTYGHIALLIGQRKFEVLLDSEPRVLITEPL